MSAAKHVGDQIIRICREYAVSRYWIANQLGVQESYISRWARNLSRASLVEQSELDALEKRLKAKRRRDRSQG
jgi:hypothetical protein